MAEPTKYVVLRRVEPNGDGPDLPALAYAPIAEVDATSREKAIEQSLGKDEDGGKFRAVPLRFWGDGDIVAEVKVERQVTVTVPGGRGASGASGS